MTELKPDEVSRRVMEVEELATADESTAGRIGTAQPAPPGSASGCHPTLSHPSRTLTITATGRIAQPPLRSQRDLAHVASTTASSRSSNGSAPCPECMLAEGWRKDELGRVVITTSHGAEVITGVSKRGEELWRVLGLHILRTDD